MRIRAGVILFSGDRIALIERVKRDRTYYVVPGGGLRDGEYSEQAARREAYEELGVSVRLERLLAIVERVERERVYHLQLNYLATQTGGEFGHGGGEEYSRAAAHGSYRPLWFPLEGLHSVRVYPRTLLSFLAEHGPPENILHLLEATNFPH